ncbi:MAG: hypothetical protein IKM66_06760 [Clostridia bacterium]|nr:hypothetical protein [Clostridia bacterium]
MTACEKLCDILEPMNLPIAEGFYNGSAKEYFTFNIFSEHPVLFADDESVEEASELYLHYFTKDNTHGNKTKIKKLLRNNDVNVIDIETLHENDTGYLHVIFQLQLTNDIDERNEN